MSTHRVDVIRMPAIDRHPNADTLGLVRLGEFTCVVKLGDFNEGDTVIYIEPDYVVPESPLFAFLGKNTRIRTRRFRGIWSQGLIIKAPEGFQVGENAMQALGITRYEPPEPPWGSTGFGVGGAPVGLVEAVPASLRAVPKYDLENWRKYSSVLERGESIIVTEKIHGANARFCFVDGVQYCGGRTQWRKEDPKNVYWEGLKQNPWIGEWCQAHPEQVLFGEVYGMQDLRYGSQPGQVFFRAFDILTSSGFRENGELLQLLEEDQQVPIVYQGPYWPSMIEELAEGDSTVCPGQVGEGVVIKPAINRHNSLIGRVALKCVSNRYLERAK